jgi:O-antigen/teichoic acid export membrane protein
LTGVGWTALALTAVLGQDIVTVLYGPKWVECVPAILPLTIAAAIGMLFNYIPIAITAIGRPYLSAVPLMVSVLSRVGFSVLLFNGSLSGFAWALCLATIATVPFIAAQQRRHFGFGIRALLRAMMPSAIVMAGTAAAGAALAEILPADLSAMARLLIIGVPVIAVWCLLIMATRHELLSELYRLAAPIKLKFRTLRSNI